MSNQASGFHLESGPRATSTSSSPATASLTRQLGFLMAVVVVLAGSAAAQLSRNHMRQPHAKDTSIDEVVKQLASEDPEKRLDAVKALGLSKDSKATEYLIRAVDDSDVRVQAKAIQILGDMRASESTPTLVQCMILRTTDTRMTQLIIASLGKIGDPRAAQPLIELLQHNDRDPTTRGTAVFALGEIGAPEAIEVLEHIAQTDEEPAVRRVASEAKSKIEAHQGSIDTQLTVPSQPFVAPTGPPHSRSDRNSLH